MHFIHSSTLRFRQKTSPLPSLFQAKSENFWSQVRRETVNKNLTFRDFENPTWTDHENTERYDCTRYYFFVPGQISSRTLFVCRFRKKSGGHVNRCVFNVLPMHDCGSSLFFFKKRGSKLPVKETSFGQKTQYKECTRRVLAWYQDPT